MPSSVGMRLRFRTTVQSHSADMMQERARVRPRQRRFGVATCSMVPWWPLPSILMMMMMVLNMSTSAVMAAASRQTNVHTGWIACRPGPDPSQGCLSNHQHGQRTNAAEGSCHSSNSNSSVWTVRSLPTTALAVLLDHRQIPGVEDITMENLYYSTNMRRIPDISEVGRDYYTLLYELDLTATGEAQLTGNNSRDFVTPRTTLNFAGINYRATAWLNGTMLTDLGQGCYDCYNSSINSQVSGMFIRRSFDVTEGGRFTLLIEPPDHPGRITDGGQGGDHTLAQDGATAQYMQGWDWCQGMPDRATGFYGSVSLKTTAGPLSLVDPTVQTVQWLPASSSYKLRLLVRLQGVVPSLKILTVHVASDWGEEWIVSIQTSDTTMHSGWIHVKETVVVAHPQFVTLWWPHGLGQEPHGYLHTFTFTVSVHGVLLDQTELRVGIRTIESRLDQHTQGQSFAINGHDVYLVGGNWISTDQALQYSASEERYCDELALHKYAGLNLIRVWGGGTAERDQFYDCADRLGLLVYQEFWMTGDNNGRWAGNYSWPVDYKSYLANALDTIQRLRNHPSLLFYGGCNECLAPRTSTWFPNPPRSIDNTIRRLLVENDPGRFYIASSMGGFNKADTFFDPTLYDNRTFSLAFADGPYEMLLPETYFDLNPGLPFKNITIGFQPEIGSVGMPTRTGLLRFMDLRDIESGVPRRNSLDSANEDWRYHKFLPLITAMSRNKTYDHVYAYFSVDGSISSEDWIAAAQLASHFQYQHLFHGFISQMYNYTTAVILWKTQSPWPALRGFLYDYYLESTGALRGVRSAIGSAVSLTYDLKSQLLFVVNRQVHALLPSKDDPIGARYSWINLKSKTVHEGTRTYSGDNVSAMRATPLGKPVKWPREGCAQVCFLRLSLLGHTTDSSTTWLWLTNPALGNASDFSQIGKLRQRQQGGAHMEVLDCVLNDRGLSITLNLSSDSEPADLLFYPVFSLYRFQDGAPLLPLFDSQETDVIVVSGTSQIRFLHSPATIETYSYVILLVLTSWNAPPLTQVLTCERSIYYADK